MEKCIIFFRVRVFGCCLNFPSFPFDRQFSRTSFPNCWLLPASKWHSNSNIQPNNKYNFISNIWTLLYTTTYTVLHFFRCNFTSCPCVYFSRIILRNRKLFTFVEILFVLSCAAYTSFTTAIIIDVINISIVLVPVFILLEQCYSKYIYCLQFDLFYRSFNYCLMRVI